MITSKQNPSTLFPFVSFAQFHEGCAPFFHHIYIIYTRAFLARILSVRVSRAGAIQLIAS